MKRTNKITAAIISAAFAVFMMTACSGGTSPENSGATTEAAPPQNEASSVTAGTEHAHTDAANSSNSSDIGFESVKAIVLAKVPGAAAENIHEFEREIDDGRIEYEGSIYYNGYEYEFEVDGATGSILKWEIDD